MGAAYTSPAPAAFFDGIRHAGDAALASAGVVERYYLIGGQPVRLRFAGSALLPAVTPAMAHLAVGDDGPPSELTISCWDTETTGVPLPFLDVWNDCTERGAVRAFIGSSLAVTRLQEAGVCSVLDPARGEAYYWAQSTAAVPSYESGAPFRGLLHAWWRNRGGLLLHAGAVGTDNGGALLVGRGGSGKSTAALACLHGGMHYAADDYCLVVRHSAPVVHSLYCSLKLRPQQLERFPALRPLAKTVGEFGDVKALCFLHGQPGLTLTRSFPLRAVLMPRVTGLVDTTLTPATAVAALQALAPSALMQLPDAGAAEFAAIRALVTQAPCFWLEAGTDLQQIPARVREAIAG